LNIIGISAFYHDSACCLIADGKLVAAAQEERFTRIKHDPGLPINAFLWCLKQGELTIDNIDCIAFYEVPGEKLQRQLSMALPDFPPSGISHLLELNPRRAENAICERLGYSGKIQFVPHHLSHAASSFYYSEFPESALMVVDAVGEWATTSYGTADSNGCTLFDQVDFPDSIGLLYSTITSYLGFSVNDSEYKVMGLAAYGKPLYIDKIQQLIKTGTKGDFHLDASFFDFSSSKKMYTKLLTELLGQPPRLPEEKITECHKDIASSLQIVVEEILLQKVRYLHQQVPSDQLCLAGGVALNCVANGRIKRESPFKKLFIQPAAGDAGTCIGAATVVLHRLTEIKPDKLKMSNSLLGPSINNSEVIRLLEAGLTRYHNYEGKEDKLLHEVAAGLAEGKVVGWCYGRMEFGPRALGARSILGSPSDPDMQNHINVMVKKRETFRPFGPAVTEEDADRYFDLDAPSPYMLITTQAKKWVSLPSVTHADGSARVQTVSHKEQPRFHRLLKIFEKIHGHPVLLNTSFNMQGEPIVCTPEDAIICFIKSGLDILVLGDILLYKEEVPVVWREWFYGYDNKEKKNNNNDVYAML